VGAYLDMEIEFDPEKDAINIAKHGISLARALEMHVLGHRLIERSGERRLLVVGLIDGANYALIAVFRRNALRAISLRRAHKKEILDVTG